MATEMSPTIPQLVVFKMYACGMYDKFGTKIVWHKGNLTEFVSEHNQTTWRQGKKNHKNGLGVLFFT